MPTDQDLVDYVVLAMRTGAREIEVPFILMEHASKDVLQEIRSLCKINNVRLVVRA